MRKLVTRIIFVLVLVMVLTVPVMGYTMPDASTQGSLTITMKIDGEAVAGGKITLYKTGEIDPRARTYIFVHTEEFRGCQVPLNDIDSSEVAGILAEYAKENSIAGISKTIGASGVVCFKNLSPGLYMVVQDIAAEGYLAAAPFQIAVPGMGEGGLDYDAEAFPKIVMQSWGEGGDVPDDEDKNESETPENKTEETEVSLDKYLEGDAELKDGDKTGDEGKIGDGGKLPQTGQLKWPVPVLAILGLVMFAAGWIIRNAERRDSYEK